MMKFAKENFRHWCEALCSLLPSPKKLKVQFLPDMKILYCIGICSPLNLVVSILCRVCFVHLPFSHPTHPCDPPSKVHFHNQLIFPCYCLQVSCQITLPPSQPSIFFTCFQYPTLSYHHASLIMGVGEGRLSLQHTNDMDDSTPTITSAGIYAA